MEEIMRSPLVRKILTFVLCIALLNFVVVPLGLYFLQGKDYALNYFMKVSVGVLYLGCTLGSLILYNSNKIGVKNLLIAQVKVDNALKKSDIGKAKELQVAELGYRKVEAENEKRFNLKSICDTISLFFRALALIFAMYVFFNYFGVEAEKNITNNSDIKSEIDGLKKSIARIDSLNKLNIDRLITVIDGQSKTIEEFESRIILLESLKKGPKQ